MKAVANPKPRRLSKADKADISRASLQNMVQEIQELERRVHDLGVHVTARTLNQAKNALGWELAGDTVMAGRAARGERPEDEQ